MGKLLRFDSSSGPITIGIGTSQDITAVGGLDSVIEKAEQSFDGVLRMVGAIAESFAENVSKTSAETAELEFGLQFTGKGTLFVVESQAQASLRVTLKFRTGAAT
jgi:Trypsin-co-occurring domain 1